MVVSSALAFDNGFRVIVVFTSNYSDLVKQTAKRLEIVEGPIVRSSVSLDVLEKDAARIEQAISTHGLLIVCAKDPNHILSLVDFLRKVRADRYPALIFDDEADQATPDTTANARSSGRKSPPLHSKNTINRRIVRNNARDAGESIREVLRHNVFVQVTATPYALLLQGLENPLRPKFSRLLEPGPGYTGGDAFFSDDHIADDEPQWPLVYVREEESKEIDETIDPQHASFEGLGKAISFFVIAAAARAILEPSARLSPQTFLCHTSAKTSDHTEAGPSSRARSLVWEITSAASFMTAVSEIGSIGRAPSLGRRSRRCPASMQSRGGSRTGSCRSNSH